MFTASSWWYCHYAFYSCKCRWLKIFWSLQLILCKQFSVCCFLFQPTQIIIQSNSFPRGCEYWVDRLLNSLCDDFHFFFPWVSPNSLQLLTRKKLLVIQKYFCSASPRTGDGLWKLELKTPSNCLAWIGEVTCYTPVAVCRTCLFELLFQHECWDDWNQEQHSMIRLIFCEWLCCSAGWVAWLQKNEKDSNGISQVDRMYVNAFCTAHLKLLID